MQAACTIVSPNYLPFARTLAASYQAQHPDQRFFVLIVADLADPFPFQIDSSFEPVMLHEIGVPDLRLAAMRYDILELNTNVKPTLLKHLLRTYELEAVVYLDPDIFLYRGLDPIFESLRKGATAVLTPHMTAPIFDGHSPSEQDLLYNGTYNLGFIGVSGTAEAQRFLDWWEQRCLELGYSEGRTGLFVDQKWINLVPGLFEGVEISRDPGLNMAYWNLHERVLREMPEGVFVDSQRRPSVPLRFFHFSGLALSEPEGISRNTDRFTLADRSDLRKLFGDYKAALRARSGHPAEELPYGFDRFSDGTAITRLARRLFAAHEKHFVQAGSTPPDPFDANSSFCNFARRQGLVKGQATSKKATWKEFNPRDRRVTAIYRMLRLALRVLGPDRYELLMRFLSHITVLRSQAVFLRDPRWPEAPADAEGS